MIDTRPFDPALFHDAAIDPETFLAVLNEPGSCRFAIVRSCWVRMFRCQPIFDGDDSLPCVVGDPLQHRILHVGAAKHPAATMEMQVDPPRGVRWHNNAQGNLVSVVARNGDGSRPIREHGCGERPLAASG